MQTKKSVRQVFSGPIFLKGWCWVVFGILSVCGCAQDETSDAESYYRDGDTAEASTSHADGDTDTDSDGDTDADTDTDTDTDTDADVDTDTDTDSDTDADLETDRDTADTDPTGNRTTDSGDSGTDSDADTDIDTDTDTDTDSDSDTDTDADTDNPDSKTCQYTCAWGEGDCIWRVGGTVVPGICSNSGQICCEPNSTDAVDSETETDEGKDTEAGSICADDKPTYEGNGAVDWHSFSQDNVTIGCSYEFAADDPNSKSYVYTGDGQYLAAMNTMDFDAGAVCGACVEVTRERTGASVVATIVEYRDTDSPDYDDTAGHITLSLEAYRVLADPETEAQLGDSVYDSVSWQYVDCPVATKNVFLRFRRSEGGAVTQLLVLGARYPVKSIKSNGTKLTRQSDNYYGIVSPAPFSLEIQDINGAVIRTTLDPREDEIDVGQQFPRCR